MDVLFLTVSAGGGHFKAAEAIKQQIEKKYPGSRTLVVDTLRYANPMVDRLLIGGYLNTLKNTPQLYGFLYNITETGGNVHDISKTINKLLSFKIRNLINEFKPSIIVCTHFLPIQMLSDLKRKGKVDVPTLAILTDYASHAFWLHSHIDAYVVAHSNMIGEMTCMGIPEETIYPYGIPVSEVFRKKRPRSEILKELHLDDMLTVLVMGGSLGFGEMRTIFKSLLNFEKDLQILAVAGKNLKLKMQLEKFSLSPGKKVKVFSYTDMISDLMDVSDYIITKPGGMTISEALVKGLPIFIMSPLPGVEQRNANFLIKNGAAASILDSNTAHGVLSQMHENPLKVKHMTEMTKLVAKPDAAGNVLELMETLVSVPKNLYVGDMGVIPIQSH